MFSEKSGYAKRRLAAQWSGKQSYLNWDVGSPVIGSNLIIT